MPVTFTCTHCEQTALQNIRLKKPQQYCSQSVCQQARCRAWKKKQYHENEDYRKRCLADQKKWRQSYPADQYQKNYRDTHPEYVLRNRELQRQRNRSRREAPQTTIIKKDTLLFHPGEGGIWFLSKACREMIVNRNAIVRGVPAVYIYRHKNTRAMSINIKKIPLSEFDLSLSEIRLMHYGRALKVEKSMQVNGQLQPVVARVCDGPYQLIDGFKRYYAAEVLMVDTLECRVLDVSLAQAKILLLSYNRTPQAMEVWEEAMILEDLQKTHDMDQKQLWWKTRPKRLCCALL